MESIVIESTRPLTAVIRIKIGETFFPVLIWRDSITKKPVLWGGFAGYMVMEFPGESPIILNAANGGLVLDLVNPGHVNIFISDITTSSYEPKTGKFKLFITDSLGRKSSWLEGVVRVYE
jgi:hypothetical protein